MITSARLLLLAALPALLGRGAGVVGGAGGEVVSLLGQDAAGAPMFVPGQRTRVRGVEGRSVTFQCRVLNLGDKAVSWVRTRDLQILSHSGVVFTADARVSVPPPPSPATVRSATRTYALRIDRLRAADAGRYECQLNTEPKMSLFFDLSVVDEFEATETPEPSTIQYPWDEDEIEMWVVEKEVCVAEGGNAELACEARVLSKPFDAAPPLDIRWIRAGKPLTLQDGYTVLRLASAAQAESRLRLSGARAADAGEYTCAVGPRSATITLTVSDRESVGEMEMQRDQWAGGVASEAGALTTQAPLVTVLATTLATLLFERLRAI
ncbi:hypothetical protein O0L34_g15252 [Tuta absoluta]|nr:hypothetical protein O0L34_g15252 [Tuta absoluta]